MSFIFTITLALSDRTFAKHSNVIAAPSFTSRHLKATTTTTALPSHEIQRNARAKARQRKEQKRRVRLRLATPPRVIDIIGVDEPGVDDIVEERVGIGVLRSVMEAHCF